MKLVALTGPKYTGKTKLAHELEARGYMLINFTDQLKELYLQTAQAMALSVTMDDLTRNKEYYRQQLQDFAVLIGFNRDPYFVERSLRPWKEAGCPSAAFDNVRFIEQYLCLRRYDFKLVELTLPAHDRYQRALKHYSKLSIGDFMTTASYEAEHAIGRSWADLILDAGLPVTALAEEIVHENMPRVPVAS
jgi:dephospho-CoA kinase